MSSISNNFVRDFGPWALVAGASEGIGKAFACEVASKGMNVVIISRRKNLLEELATKIKELLDLVGVDKSLDTKASDLSYGQKRLVEIARVLMMDYKILLLDEPTAGVNPATRNKLKILLRKLRNQGKTIFLIEHDMDFVMSLSDEVIMMDAGR